MTDSDPRSPGEGHEDPPRRLSGIALVLAGIVATQAILFGPSLVGRKILLPLDVLARRNYWVPKAPGAPEIAPHNLALSDQVLAFEPGRRWAAAELRAGRIPLWNPHNYAGAPFAAFWTWSLPHALYYLLPSSYFLAWLQLLKSAIAGLGAYVFFRRVLGAGFWPAALGGWCYPLTGFFVLWQGFPLSNSVVWLPWVLLATHRAIRRPAGLGGPALALTSGLALLGGQVGPQVLLASGVFAVWCVLDRFGRGALTARRALGAVAATSCGWGLGILLAMPQWLPLVEYGPSTARFVERAAGREERPPAGLAALPQVVLPDVYGSRQHGSVRIVPGNRVESSAAAYTGLLATLVLAPLAWSSRAHRSRNALWCTIAFLALGWVLNVPGLVALLRMPGLGMLSHNRSVFAASFAVLALAVTGVDALRRRDIALRRWLWIPVAVLAVLGGWCAYRSIRFPEPLATQLEAALVSGRPMKGVATHEMLQRIQEGFVQSYVVGVALCGLAVAAWLALRAGATRARWPAPVLGALLVGELLWFAHGVNPQCDPELDYPAVALLERLEDAGGGRVLGVGCLPPGLNLVAGLRDVRGYDGADPARIAELLDIPRDRRYPRNRYALTQWLMPRLRFVPPHSVQCSPVLDMLGVRYLVFRSTRPAGAEPLMAQDDYWVLDNPRALPRAWVPRRVVTVADDEEGLRRLAEATFDPREVAFVQAPAGLPDDCRGTVEVIDEIPTRVTLSVDMATAGLVVLADAWYPGWRASLDGRRVPVRRVNHAIRGVVVPAGPATLTFDYDPAGFRWGVRLAIAGCAALLLWPAASAVGIRTRNIRSSRTRPA